VEDEVRAHSPALLERPRLVVATKRDAVSERDPLPELRTAARDRGLEVVPVSAVTGEGLLDLKRAVLRLIDKAAVEAPLPQEEA
jgi:GTP-binding protein